MPAGHQNLAVREAAVRLAHEQADCVAIDHGSIAGHENAAVCLPQMQVAPRDRDNAQAFRGRNITADNHSTDQGVAHFHILGSGHVASHIVSSQLPDGLGLHVV